MARVKGGDRVHVFESLSDLQVMQNLSWSMALRSLQSDALRAQRPMCLMPRFKTCNDVWRREVVRPGTEGI